MTSLPKIFAHRGAPAAPPENTLEGFQYAMDAGADGIELDLLLTRDGAGDWLHGKAPAIRDLTLEELRCYDVGGLRPGAAPKPPHQAQLQHCRIPTLDEFLTQVKTNAQDIELLVELKHSPTANSQVQFLESISK
ncbi:glycerophosphodiester phosphodiesterase family protein [Parasedimentitalea psychrophila]|uniref:Glycerophosphodiester phosphodiesterase family protein n=1 Tax=Parasedimentitalea psychrophila TaxID=2997337 RepID=A0A9Y2P5P9_9RHOB|nr:glycerophosphodiester phosphodiesterase family protein [Parasedimentitalea psychrophila]WIY26594.1 glycerophosphodiester phosphodiesterase family protein [Parasedimentitalea psychrophila]